MTKDSSINWQGQLALEIGLPVAMTWVLIAILALVMCRRRKRRETAQGDYNAQPFGIHEPCQRWSKTSFTTTAHHRTGDVLEQEEAVPRAPLAELGG